MKLTVGFQQAITIMALIASQKNGAGLNIRIIAKQMKINESYLRKLARKLVTADLLTSSKSRFSGYTLKSDPKEITLLDVFNAIEGEDSFLEHTGIITQTFNGVEEVHVAQKMNEVLHVLDTAETLYRKELSSYTLDSLLETANNGVVHEIDWILRNGEG
ncbi:transcriptional regulator, BadM/Rrf2 family [Pilibacter termitis]|uniref:Transcriptional regulator, BadM/Rrf2 family n=1 Tax=Pilibacter termitis TaxID=263852 RepID=A0A1T4P847_9ENTE|nr:Rrf2 family transcriptional regulator [Pilibacter termitis]SJZ87755.1 transcriptional regulator, BadM/Rrf2 family [Pilibacter termitis]